MNETEKRKIAKKKGEKETIPFYMPKDLYDEIMAEIEEREKLTYKPDRKKFDSTCKGRCFQTSYIHMNSTELTKRAFCYANVLESAKQAFEDKNFRTLYQIIGIGLEFKHRGTTTQLIEYLLAAIEIDPAIPDRLEFFMSVVKGLSPNGQSYDQVPKEIFIKKFHLLEERKRKGESSSDSSSDDEN